MQCTLIELNNPIGMAVNGPHQMHNKCKVIVRSSKLRVQRGLLKQHGSYNLDNLLSTINEHYHRYPGYKYALYGYAVHCTSNSVKKTLGSCFQLTNTHNLQS